MSEVPINTLIASRLDLPRGSVNNTIQLLKEGATIPFIARYRKEATQSLDELAIAEIQKEWLELQELIKRKQYIINTLQEQGKLTGELKKKINDTWDSTTLEDIYLPFKKKRKTRAAMAREKGLEPLAHIIMKQSEPIRSRLSGFLNDKVKTKEEALQGARDIIAEIINENAEARERLRSIFRKSVHIHSRLIRSKQAEAIKYKDYFEYKEKAAAAPAHRILAVMRAEKEGLLRVKFEIDEAEALKSLQYLFVRRQAHPECRQQLMICIEDALKRLLLPSIETEFRNIYKAKADEEAISVFSKNLKQLLLAAPLGEKRVMGIDPGFRTGCKLVCLDRNGQYLKHTSIFPHPPQNKWDESRHILRELAHEYDIEALAIGNGTAGKESFALAKSVDFKDAVEIYLVNENGASIYSASEIARAEFPELDLTVRGAISIGRRLMDPLSELVKIDPKSIGVGQYQHDVNQTKLKDRLHSVVEHCVNAVGVDLNTASEHLLSYISGLGPVLAKNIVKYRKKHGSFKDISSLLKVPRMGAKSFEQSAGFLRVRNGQNMLDNTGVHPERYPLVKKIARDAGKPLEDLLSHPEALKQIKLEQYIDDRTGWPTLNDIIAELAKPGFDIRGKAQSFEFTPGIQSIEDLQPGMFVKGIVNNITKFGAFVDIGIKEAGLIHISEMAHKFVKDPLDILKLNQQVEAKVLEVDISRKRIALSLKY